ncbi:MAG: hypothetical protein WB698_11715 [Solirubrobacteraceae bacterium]
MEPRRQLTRYAITGGYALMIGAFYEAVFGVAWKEQVEGLIPITKADAFTTLGGAVAVGFVLYQLYSALDRPRVQVTFAFGLPRWLPIAGHAWKPRMLRLPLFGERDASGAVLDALQEIPAVQRALAHAYGIPGADDASDAQALSDLGSVPQRAHDENANVLNSVLNLTYSSGDGQIARSYAALEDIYHALGACHAALIAVSLATALDIIGAHTHAYLAHLDPSIAVTVLALLLIWGSHCVIKVNRRRRWAAMTHQLQNDLRAWALRHPQLLSQLAAEPTEH